MLFLMSNFDTSRVEFCVKIKIDTTVTNIILLIKS